MGRAGTTAATPRHPAGRPGTVSCSSRGWNAGKKVNGRKRHLAVDTMGLLLVVLVTAASVQDRDAARPLRWRLRASDRGIRLVWADAGYPGKLVAWAATCCAWWWRWCASILASRSSKCCPDRLLDRI
jgi:DDE family transposase